MNKKKYTLSFFFIFFQLIIAVAFMYIMKNETDSLRFFILNLIFYVLIFIIPVLIYILKILHKNPLSYLKLFDEKSFSGILIGLLISAFITIIFLIKNEFRIDLVSINSEKLFVLICVTLAGFFEEISFRGFYLKVFKERFGFWWSNALTSVLFAFLHFGQVLSGQYIQILMLFVISLWLGYIYEKTKSLWAPIIVHSVFNILTVLF